jgi:hypothetical protein
MANHTLELTRGAVQLLEQMLMQPEWAKDTATLYRAGALLERIDGEFGGDKAPEVPKWDKDEEPDTAEVEQFNRQMDEWANRSVEFEVSEKEREACKTCVNESVKKGQVRPTKHYMRIAQALGLAED